MLKTRFSILLVLPILILGLCLTAAGREKPVPVISNTAFSPNATGPSPDPNWEAKEAATPDHEDSYVPLEDPPESQEEYLPGESPYEQYVKRYGNAITDFDPGKEPYSGPEHTNTEPRAGGETIETATVIPSLPYTDSDNSCTFVNDYDEACPYTGSTAPDAVYEYSPSVDETVDISLCNSGYDTKLYLYEDSHTPGTPFACNDDGCPNYRSFLGEVTLYGGHTYYIVVDGYGANCGDYILEITYYVPPEPFECPEGAFTEAEPCGDDANGGCNMATPTFEAINDGETVCGTIWAADGTRDTDWYELTLTGAATVTWTAMGTFDFVIGFVDTSDCSIASQLDPYATGSLNDTLAVSRIAGPGTYWLFVSHQTYYDQPCGTSNDYWASVTVEAITSGACCDPATGTCTPDVDEPTCLAMYGGTGVWHGGVGCDPNPCPPPVTPGDNCAEPYVVSLPGELPFSNTSYTCGRVDDYDATCMGYYDGGEDMIYEITVTADVFVDVLLDPMGTYWTGVGIFGGCPDVGACLDYSTSGYSTTPHGFGIFLAAGVYYLMVDTWPSPECIETFTLTITEGTAPVGRCCYGDPQGTLCDDVTEAECTALGGEWTEGTDCTTEPCVIASPGDNCSNPIEVKLPGDLTPDYVDVNYTCDRGNNYASTCLGSYDGGEDIIYWLDVDTPIDIDVVLDPMGTTWTGIALGATCPLPSGSGDCIAKHTQSGSTPHGFYAVHLEPGSYYIQIDTWPSPNCIPEFTLTISQSAGPPENDDWDKCDEIGEVTDVPFSTVSATFDGPGSCQTAPNVWYCYTASCDGDAFASLCGSGYDTKMAVYDGVGDPSTLTQIGCNDDYDCPTKALQSQVNWYATAGMSYLIEVGGYSSNVGEGVISTGCEPDTCTPSPNDNCEDVTPVELTMGVTHTFYGDNTCSHNDCALLVNNGEAWEAFTITEKADVVLDYCGTSPSFELVYVVLADACPCDAGSGELVYYDHTNWDVCGDGNVTIYYPALDAGTYYIPVLSDHPDYPSSYYEGPYQINILATTWVPHYCDADGGCDEYIENVSFGAINNSSSCEGYGDFTALSTFLTFGSSTPITITIGNPYSSDYGAVWIDWNQDYDFDDANEAIPLDVYVGYGPYTGTVVVPGDALAGPTRMRVRLSYYSLPPPCGTTSYGEAEDYTVVVGGTAPNLTLDPTEIDFGVVEPNASGSTSLTLGSDNEVPISFSTEIVYGGKGTGVGGGDCAADLKANPFQQPSIIPAQGDKETLWEGFEGGVIPPEGWTVVVNNAFTWEIGTYAPYEGSYYATCYYDENYTGTQDEWLISPTLNLDGNYALSFWWNGSYYWSVDPYDNCDLNVKISIDGGSTWTQLWNEDMFGVFTNWTWYNMLIPLTAYTGETNVKIAFNYYGYDGAQLSVDAVSLEAAPMNWLSVAPETGTVPGNGTLEMGVFYDMIGLDYGVYTADIVISHSGAKGVATVPVTIEIGETGVNILTVEPYPMYAIMEHPYGDMSAFFYLGGEFAGGGHVVEEIDLATVQVMGMTPISTEILEGYEGFSGHVLKIECGIVEFIQCYPLLWDVTMQDYHVTGDFTAGGSFDEAAQVMMIGHTSGDANFDGAINILDITYMISYIYKGGPEPQPVVQVGDTNGDGMINILDTTRLIAFLYKGGPAPTHP